jgi:hypothetical protein
VLGDYSYIIEDCDAWATRIGGLPTSLPPLGSMQRTILSGGRRRVTYRAFDCWENAEHEEDFSPGAARMP